MNAFIATFAKEEANWRTEVEFANSPSDIPPGKQLSYSPIVGYFTFRPKSWDQLSVLEKEDVMSNPKLKAFLISLRSSSMPQYTNQVRRGLRVSRNVGAESEIPELDEAVRENLPPTPSPAPTPAKAEPKPTPNIKAMSKSELKNMPEPNPTPTAAPAPSPTPKLNVSEPPAPSPTPAQTPAMKNYSIDAEDLVGTPEITIQLQP